MAGLAMAALCLGGFWARRRSLLQERSLGMGRIRKDGRSARAIRESKSVFRRGIREYMRRDFHPSQADTDRLTDDDLAGV